MYDAGDTQNKKDIENIRANDIANSDVGISPVSSYSRGSQLRE